MCIAYSQKRPSGRGICDKEDRLMAVKIGENRYVALNFKLNQFNTPNGVVEQNKRQIMYLCHRIMIKKRKTETKAPNYLKLVEIKLQHFWKTLVESFIGSFTLDTQKRQLEAIM